MKSVKTNIENAHRFRVSRRELEVPRHESVLPLFQAGPTGRFLADIGENSAFFSLGVAYRALVKRSLIFRSVIFGDIIIDQCMIDQSR